MRLTPDNWQSMPPSDQTHHQDKCAWGPGHTEQCGQHNFFVDMTGNVRNKDFITVLELD